MEPEELLNIAVIECCIKAITQLYFDQMTHAVNALHCSCNIHIIFN